MSSEIFYKKAFIKVGNLSVFVQAIDYKVFEHSFILSKGMAEPL